MRNLHNIVKTPLKYEIGDTLFLLETGEYFKLGKIIISEFEEEISFYNNEGEYMECFFLDTIKGEDNIFNRRIFTESEANELGFYKK